MFVFVLIWVKRIGSTKKMNTSVIIFSPSCWWKSRLCCSPQNISGTGSCLKCKKKQQLTLVSPLELSNFFLFVAFSSSVCLFLLCLAVRTAVGNEHCVCTFSAILVRKQWAHSATAPAACCGDSGHAHWMVGRVGEGWAMFLRPCRYHRPWGVFLIQAFNFLIAVWMLRDFRQI